MAAWLFKGGPRNVAKSLHDCLKEGRGLLLWGLNEKNRDVYDKLAIDDRVYLYAISPAKTILARGIVRSKFVDKTEYWPVDSKEGDKWPYRFWIEVDWLGVSKNELGLLENCIKNEGACDHLSDFGVSLEKLRQKIPEEVSARVFGPGSSIRLDGELSEVAQVVDSFIGTKKVRGYVSDRLLSPAQLTGDDQVERAKIVLQSYGRVILTLAELRREPIEKAVVESAAGGARADVQWREAVRDDLRRLCVISIGNGSNWPDNIPARLTNLGEILVKTVRALRNLDVDADQLLIGSLPIVFCMWGYGRDCLSEEAGVCLALAKSQTADPMTKMIVETALEILRERRAVMFLIMGYGVSPKLQGHGTPTMRP